MPYLIVAFVCVHRQWCDEQAAGVSQRAGSARPPGLVVQEEREQRLPGYEMEEVLVRPKEDCIILVHKCAGENALVVFFFLNM